KRSRENSLSRRGERLSGQFLDTSVLHFKILNAKNFSVSIFSHASLRSLLAVSSKSSVSSLFDLLLHRS
ncbi:unnamed protein product, partial [Brassica rapa subsp. trilocularis]